MKRIIGVLIFGLSFGASPSARALDHDGWWRTFNPRSGFESTRSISEDPAYRLLPGACATVVCDPDPGCHYVGSIPIGSDGCQSGCRRQECALTPASPLPALPVCPMFSCALPDGFEYFGEVPVSNGCQTGCRPMRPIQPRVCPQVVCGMQACQADEESYVLDGTAPARTDGCPTCKPMGCRKKKPTPPPICPAAPDPKPGYVCEEITQSFGIDDVSQGDASNGSGGGSAPVCPQYSCRPIKKKKPPTCGPIPDCAAPPQGMHYDGPIIDANGCNVGCGGLVPDDEVVCAIADCAAPPQGMHYEGPADQDKNGCAIGCGHLVPDRTQIDCLIADCAAPPPGMHYEGPVPTDRNGCAIGCGNLVPDGDDAVSQPAAGSASFSD